MSKIGEAVSPDGADNVGLAPTANTATAPSTKRGENRMDERTDFEADPPSSNAWIALTPADPQPDRVVPMTAEGKRHMRELLSKQTENVAHLQEGRDQLNQDRTWTRWRQQALSASTPLPPLRPPPSPLLRPLTLSLLSNRLESEEGKNTPDVFVRKETGT